MTRPKASIVDWVDLGVDTLQITQQRAMRNDLENARRAYEVGTAITLAEISNLQEMQMANFAQLRELDNKLEVLAEISWNIASYFERKEEWDRFVGEMRFSIHTMNRELDEIDGISEKYPEYALLKTDTLVAIIEERDVRVEHFSQVSMEEMRLAQELLDRVDSTRHKLVSILEGPDGN